MSAPRKLDAAGWDRIEQIAELKIAIPDYKMLAPELGISEPYLKNIMSRVMRLKRAGLPVPRGTTLRSHLTNGELDELAEKLRGRNTCDI